MAKKPPAPAPLPPSLPPPEPDPGELGRAWLESLRAWLKSGKTALRPAVLERLLTKLNRERWAFRAITPADHSGIQPRVTPLSERWDHARIAELIPPGSSVLDLGCGDGSLLALLTEKLQIRGQGIEASFPMVARCVDRGVPVLQMDAAQGMACYADHSFDWVILEETLQAVLDPTTVVEAMLRVGRKGIVTIPNFGHWLVRAQLALGGYMPVTPQLPYSWANTPNIHLLTLKDFLAWADRRPFQIESAISYFDGEVHPLNMPDDNLWAEEALFVVSAK
ncbi:MAG: methionine biosynthesis protein MetW [Planctomycetota bacterium]